MAGGLLDPSPDINRCMEGSSPVFRDAVFFIYHFNSLNMHYPVVMTTRRR